jgi:hypothetical protein
MVLVMSGHVAGNRASRPRHRNDDHRAGPATSGDCGSEPRGAVLQPDGTAQRACSAELDIRRPWAICRRPSLIMLNTRENIRSVTDDVAVVGAGSDLSAALRLL